MVRNIFRVVSCSVLATAFVLAATLPNVKGVSASAAETCNQALCKKIDDEIRELNKAKSDVLDHLHDTLDSIFSAQLSAGDGLIKVNAHRTKLEAFRARLGGVAGIVNDRRDFKLATFLQRLSSALSNRTAYRNAGIDGSDANAKRVTYHNSLVQLYTGALAISGFDDGVTYYDQIKNWLHEKSLEYAKHAKAIASLQKNRNTGDAPNDVPEVDKLDTYGELKDGALGPLVKNLVQDSDHVEKCGPWTWSKVKLSVYDLTTPFRIAQHVTCANIKLKEAEERKKACTDCNKTADEKPKPAKKGGIRITSATYNDDEASCQVTGYIKRECEYFNGNTPYCVVQGEGVLFISSTECDQKVKEGKKVILKGVDATHVRRADDELTSLCMVKLPRKACGTKSPPLKRTGTVLVQYSCDPSNTSTESRSFAGRQDIFLSCPPLPQ